MVYGFHPIRELLRRDPQGVTKVMVAAVAGKRRSEIEGLCRQHRIQLEAVTREQLNALARAGTHNGFAAVVSQPASSVAKRSADAELCVLVEDIQDPRNLGALVRVCEGAGVGRMLIRDRGSAPLSATAIKASAGASQWLPPERITNSAAQIESLKKAGFWVYGADTAGEPPWDVDLTGKVLICLGGEERGLRQRTRACCDRLLGLPMVGRVASLNVATAAAALLYEALRQRSSS